MCREAAEMLGQRDRGNTKKFLTPCRAQSVNTKKWEKEDVGENLEPATLLPMP